jgi:hypothetical protein
MNFSVHRTTLIKMVRLVAKPRHFTGRRDNWMRLSACAGKVFVEANQVVAGAEALVLADGSCWVKRTLFLKILLSYPGKVNVMVAANAQELQLESVTLRSFDYTPSAEVPEYYGLVEGASLPATRAAAITRSARRG